MHAVERGDQVQAGGPQRQLFGGRQQRDHPTGVAAAGGPELCQHGRRDVGRDQQRAVRQQPAQQPRVPSRPAADIQAGHGAAGQELADRAHRRLVGGAQRFIDHGHPLEMVARSHVRCLPRAGSAGYHHALALPSSPTVHPHGRPAALIGAVWRACGARQGHGDGPVSPDLVSNSSSRRFPVTVTHLPVTRCQICHRTVPCRPGYLSEVVTGHYRPGPSPSARPPFPVAGGGGSQRRPQMPPPACPPGTNFAAEPGRRTPAVTERGRSMVRART